MRRIHAAVAVSLVILGAGARGQESGNGVAVNGAGGHVFLGTRGLDNANYLGRVSEYDTARQGIRPSAGVNVWVQRGSRFVELRGEHRGDARDQSYEVDVQAGRHVRIRSYFLNYLHRLDHDPLSDLDAGKGGPVVRHEDFAPGVNYLPGYSEMNTEVEVTAPGARWLKFRGGHRTYERHGAVQARTMAKCSTCHVQSFTKNIDQRTHDLSGGVSLRFDKVSIDYDYLNRQFNERGTTPTLVWDAPVHPVTLLPIFSNRVIYDNRDGELPFSLVPDSRKSRHGLRARVELPKEARLSGALTKSAGRNKYTGLGVDSWSWTGKLTVPMGKRLQFTTQARQLDYDADEVFVQLSEPTALGGPHAGKTYTEVYGDFGEVSFWRYSVRSRNRFSMKGELGARVAKLTNLRGGYEFIRLKRDNYEIGQTDTNRVYVSFHRRQRSTPWGDWSARFRYVYDHNRDPFAHEHAALPPALQAEPSPGGSPFAGTQYYTIYAARQANLTSFPTQAHMVEPSATWMPNEKFSATLHYRYRKLKNEDLTQSDWSRSVHMPGVELFAAPNERIDFTAAYAFHNERSETLFSIPVYDG